MMITTSSSTSEKPASPRSGGAGADRTRPHSGISLMEKIASSMATTMKPTTSPITKMMLGSASATRRWSRLRVSVSKVAPT